MQALYGSVPPIPFDMQLWFKPNKTLAEILYMIDTTIRLRQSIPQRHIDIIGDYLVEKDDISDADKLKVIVYLANFTPGPVVLYINEIIGYGLFAERDYVRAKDDITVYGGHTTHFARVKDNEQCKGDYAMLVDKKTCVDGYYHFHLFEKGRFINEPRIPFDGNMRSYLRRLQELETVTLYGKPPMFHMKSTFGLTIAKGSEFLWFYGMDYDRAWLTAGSDQESATKKLKPTNCSICFSLTVLGCARCGTIFCSDVCKNRARHICK